MSLKSTQLYLEIETENVSAKEYSQTAGLMSIGAG